MKVFVVYIGKAVQEEYMNKKLPAVGKELNQIQMPLNVNL